MTEKELLKVFPTIFPLYILKPFIVVCRSFLAFTQLCLHFVGLQEH